MNRRDFLSGSLSAGVPFSILRRPLLCAASAAAAEEPGVTVLLVDTGRAEGRIDSRIYGRFLAPINHSVEDGLFAEQIRDAGFGGDDFKTYWQPFSDRSAFAVAGVDFQNSKESVRLKVSGGHAGIRQGRVYLEAGRKYDGALWVERQGGAPALSFASSARAALPVLASLQFRARLARKSLFRLRPPCVTRRRRWRSPPLALAPFWWFSSP